MTECEYNQATQLGKTRLMYVWGADENKRATKMKSLVRRVGNELIRRRVEDVSALTTEVYASLVDYLDGIGALRVPPFDTSACDGAGLKDLSRKRIDWFLESARRERGFPLKANTETKCIHCHDTEYRRPFISLQVYGGDLFEQADQARDFVLAKITRAVGTRAASNIAPATYELPPDAIGEAIINAIAHRDYHSNAAVEVRLFADRLEV